MKFRIAPFPFSGRSVRQTPWCWWTCYGIILLLCFQVLPLKLAQGAPTTNPVDADSILTKARSALDWINWSITKTNITYLSVSTGVPQMGGGDTEQIVRYSAPDGRLKITVISHDQDMHGAFTGQSLIGEQIGANNQFLSYAVSADQPPGLRNGFVRIVRTPKAIAKKRDFAMGSEGLSGFMDGNIFENDGTMHCVLDLASSGHPQVSNEKVGNLDCYVLQCVTPAGDLRLWIAPSEGYNLVRYNLDGVVHEGTTDPKLFSVFFEATRFMTSGGRSIIAAGRYRSTCFEAEIGQSWNGTATVNRTDVELNPDFKDSNPFNFNDVPNGIRVIFDDASGMNDRFVWSNGRPVPRIDY